MIVLSVGLSCDGGSTRLCRVFVDAAASRGVPAVSSASFELTAGSHRSKNALRDAKRGTGEGAERTGETGRR